MSVSEPRRNENPSCARSRAHRLFPCPHTVSLGHPLSAKIADGVDQYRPRVSHKTLSGRHRLPDRVSVRAPLERALMDEHFGTHHTRNSLTQWEKTWLDTAVEVFHEEGLEGFRLREPPDGPIPFWPPLEQSHEDLVVTAARILTMLFFALLASALGGGNQDLFAAVHPLLAFVPVSCLGVATAIACERTRLLWAPILVHMVYNSTLVYLALHGACGSVEKRSGVAMRHRTIIPRSGGHEPDRGSRRSPPVTTTVPGW